jgi:four helix bundle protein
MRKTGNEIVDVSFQFALSIIEYTDILESKRKFVLSNQLLKSGTSIGANIKEAQSAESKSDFIHKLKISAKEAEETDYWLSLCQYSEGYPDTVDLQNNLNSIKKLLSKIISSSKNKQTSPPISTSAHHLISTSARQHISTPSHHRIISSANHHISTSSNQHINFPLG